MFLSKQESEHFGVLILISRNRCKNFTFFSQNLCKSKGTLLEHLHRVRERARKYLQFSVLVGFDQKGLLSKVRKGR